MARVLSFSFFSFNLAGGKGQQKVFIKIFFEHCYCQFFPELMILITPGCKLIISTLERWCKGKEEGCNICFLPYTCAALTHACAVLMRAVVYFLNWLPKFVKPSSCSKNILPVQCN